MDCAGRMCKVENLILDHAAGCHVCIKCGHVRDNYYFLEENKACISHNVYNEKTIEAISDILDRIHISTVYNKEIAEYNQRNYKKSNMENLVMSIYRILNKNDFNISLNHLMQINGLKGRRIFKCQKPNETTLLDITEMVERFVQPLGLTYKDVSLIKEQIRLQPLSGHTPLTIIAGNIYLYCKNSNKQITIKKISSITQVSCISIQRYIRNKNNVTT